MAQLTPGEQILPSNAKPLPTVKQFVPAMLILAQSGETITLKTLSAGVLNPLTTHITKAGLVSWFVISQIGTRTVQPENAARFWPDCCLF